ncbi:MAG: polysaccharide deacetylase family protein, partial [Chthoniobacteraceae bacterium]
MNRKLILCCLITGLSFTGCKKLHSIFHKGPEKTAADTTAQNADAPVAPVVPKAAPVAATPTPQPVKAINKNAVAICLCYHNIEDGKSKALTISVAEFEKEMQAIKDNGFTVIGLQDFLAWRRGEKNIPAKSAIISLDDGWASSYSTAWPILKKYNYPFTLFIYINYVNSGGKSLTWDQLAEMRDAGADIECHTYSHADLRSPMRARSVDARTMGLIKADIATLGEDGWMHKEIAESKHVLEKQLGIKVDAIAYPFG